VLLLQNHSQLPVLRPVLARVRVPVWMLVLVLVALVLVPVRMLVVVLVLVLVRVLVVLVQVLVLGPLHQQASMLQATTHHCRNSPPPAPQLHPQDQQVHIQGMHTPLPP
jgi:hypothetical protein